MIGLLAAGFGVLAAGALAGVFVTVSVLIVREDRRRSLRRQSPGRVALGVRAMTGFYSRGLQRPDRPRAGRPHS